MNSMNKIPASIFKKLKGLLIRTIPAHMILEAIHDLKIKDCNNQVSMKSSSRFYHEARVQNLQNNKQSISIGSGTHLRGELLVFANGGKITIGDNCYLSENSRIWSAADIFIGNNVLISHQVNIIDTNAHETDHMLRAESYIKLVQSGHPKHQIDVETMPIVIEDNVWINFNVAILKGVRVGKGAIVAAGSIVLNDVEPFTLVAGNPARRIKSLL
jgi:acetyltransferase-like isoleucine patch superfamily enzyme